MATEAPFAYLAALHVKDWTLRIYQVPNDTRVQEQIALKGYEVYRRIKKLKG
jgi:hypothetical protein